MNRRPKGDEPTPREVLCLTLSANHELVDGAPFARFASKLTNLLEGAADLDGLTTVQAALESPTSMPRTKRAADS